MLRREMLRTAAAAAILGPLASALEGSGRPRGAPAGAGQGGAERRSRAAAPTYGRPLPGGPDYVRLVRRSDPLNPPGIMEVDLEPDPNDLPRCWKRHSPGDTLANMPRILVDGIGNHHRGIGAPFGDSVRGTFLYFFAATMLPSHLRDQGLISFEERQTIPEIDELVLAAAERRPWLVDDSLPNPEWAHLVDAEVHHG